MAENLGQLLKKLAQPTGICLGINSGVEKTKGKAIIRKLFKKIRFFNYSY
jgi:hypothetical protein